MVANTADPLWNASVTAVDRPQQGSRTLDVPAAIARAVASRSDAQVARKQQEAAGTSVKLFDDFRKPSINLVAEYGLSGIGGTEIQRQTGALGSQILGTNPGSYLDVLQSIGGLDYPTWSVGLNVTLPIGNRAAEAALARARMQERQVAAGIQALELAIAAQVTRIAEQVRSADEQVRAAAAARELAQKRLDAEQARRAAGLSTNFLVLQAQRDLATAQTAELRAALDYRTALADFDLVQEAPV
jgi:HAE1 family hydrophobic/amphiphilic exporter-1